MAGKDFANARGWQLQSFVLTYGITLAAGALILALSVERSLVSRALSGRLAVYLGKISYGFYLIQLTVVMTPLLALTDRLGVWRLAALCVLMNVVCAVLYEVVERPARRVIIAPFGGGRSE